MTIRYHKQPDAAQLRREFWEAHDEALLSRRVVAAALDRSVGWLDQQAVSGGFVPYVKLGHRCMYRKIDVLGWIAKHQVINSTSEWRREQQ